jgi:malate dehydrogenase (oxaloacetate-decarboxylating)(NADP+)
MAFGGNVLAAMNALMLEKYTLFIADAYANDDPSEENWPRSRSWPRKK